MINNNGNKVYNHIKKYVVPSMHNDTTNYLVCYGYVDWNKDGDLKPAIYVLMEYKGYIKYSNPPHILTIKDKKGKSDLDKVLEKIDLLREEYNM